MNMTELHTMAPEWMPTHIDGNPVIAWRLMTEYVSSRDQALPVGYQIVVHGSVLEARLDGVITRATLLNMT